MSFTTDLKDLIGVEGLERDEYPELAGLLDKYQELRAEDINDLARFVNLVETYKSDIRKLIEGHQKLAQRVTRLTPDVGWRTDTSRLDSSIAQWSTQVHESSSMEPPAEEGVSSVDTQPPFRFFGRDTDRVHVELEVYIPWDLWRQGTDIRGDDKYELIRTYRKLKPEDLA